MVIKFSEKYHKIIILFIILLVICSTYLLFLPAFKAYFFQDDWFSFSISQASNIKEFLRFFNPVQNVIYYRPLGMQLPFFLVRHFFGLNPFPFRIATFLIHLINGFLVYQLLYFFLKEKKLSLTGSFFYLTSASHMIIFFWAATFSFVLASLFYFWTFLLYLKGKQLTAILVFLTGLLSNELLITIPFILTAWELIQKRKTIRNMYSFFVIAFGYVLLRLTVAKFSTSEGYSLLISAHQFLLNLRDYFLWSFNWADEIHNQFISFFQLNPIFIENFKSYFLILSISSIIFLFFFVVAPIYFLLKDNRKDKNIIYKFYFGILWFFITLSPVLFFSKHYFSYYIPIPLFGLLLSSMTLFSYAKNFINKGLSLGILLITMFLWYWSSQNTIRLNLLIHWAPQRAARSKELVTKILKTFPTLPDNTTIFVKGNSHDTDINKWALGDQNGLQVLYNNTSIDSIYGSMDEYLLMLQREIDKPKSSQIIELP